MIVLTMAAQGLNYIRKHARRPGDQGWTEALTRRKIERRIV